MVCGALCGVEVGVVEGIGIVHLSINAWLLMAIHVCISVLLFGARIEPQVLLLVGGKRIWEEGVGPGLLCMGLLWGRCCGGAKSWAVCGGITARATKREIKVGLWGALGCGGLCGDNTVEVCFCGI